METSETKEQAKREIRINFPELTDDEINALVCELSGFTIKDANDYKRRMKC